MSQPQPSYPPAAPQPPKKKRKWPLIVGGLVVLIIVIAVANGGTKDPAPANTTAAAQPAAPSTAAPAEQPKKSTRAVLYEVLGSGTATSITYTTDGMTSTEQVGQAALPWSKQIELPAGEALQMVSLMAQAGQGSTEISARVTVDGKVVKEGKSSGPFAVVSVNENIGSLGK